MSALIIGSHHHAIRQRSKKIKMHVQSPTCWKVNNRRCILARKLFQITRSFLKPYQDINLPYLSFWAQALTLNAMNISYAFSSAVDCSTTFWVGLERTRRWRKLAFPCAGLRDRPNRVSVLFVIDLPSVMLLFIGDVNSSDTGHDTHDSLVAARGRSKERDPPNDSTNCKKCPNKKRKSILVQLYLLGLVYH